MLSRYMRPPIIGGMIVIFIMIQVSNVALPGWIGLPQSPGFPLINFLHRGALPSRSWSASLCGAVRFRRAAILIGLAGGTICYAIFRPVSLAAVADAPWLVVPQLFPFGFAVETDLVIVFLLVLLPASVGSMALYQMVGDWGGQTVHFSANVRGCFRHRSRRRAGGPCRRVQHDRLIRIYRHAAGERVGRDTQRWRPACC